MGLFKRLATPFSLKHAANEEANVRKPRARKSSAARSAGKAKTVKLNPYRAVSIVAGACACEPAIALRGKRFLVTSGEVPMLPMPECTAAKCACRYSHHEDRRDLEAGDRRQWSSLQSELFNSKGNSNRRTRSRGRRKTD